MMIAQLAFRPNEVKSVYIDSKLVTFSVTIVVLVVSIFSGCRGLPVASMSNCSIPIQSHDLGSSGNYDAYNAWRKGDRFLDWHGPEPGQGTFQGKQAFGTPAVWTTNNPSDDRYNKLNT